VKGVHACRDHASVDKCWCADPNLDVQVVKQRGQLPAIRLLVRRPVAANEQLTVTYIDAALPTSERREFLHNNYGFWCGCALCREAEEERERS